MAKSNLIPILAGGAALLFLGGKKKKSSSGGTSSGGTSGGGALGGGTSGGGASGGGTSGGGTSGGGTSGGGTSGGGTSGGGTSGGGTSGGGTSGGGTSGGGTSGGGTSGGGTSGGGTSGGEAYGKPPLGPSGSGSCVGSSYSRDPQYMSPDISVSDKAMTLFDESGYFFYMPRSFQNSIYDFMLDRFNTMRDTQQGSTVASVVLRDALKEFNSTCNWYGPIGSLDKPAKMMWDGGRRLAIMAQETAGVFDPSPGDLFQTGQRFTVTRDSLGLPDPGVSDIGQVNRVEIIATDKGQENAEHIIGQVVGDKGPNGEKDLFEVRIVGEFNGSDVSPKLRIGHRFKVGSNAFFSKKGPMGIFRIFPKSME